MNQNNPYHQCHSSGITGFQMESVGHCKVLKKSSIILAVIYVVFHVMILNSSLEICILMKHIPETC